MPKRLLCALGLLLVVSLMLSFSKPWGFWAHKRINRLAVFTLPNDMFGFYKENIEYITEHAIDPDKRRYAIKAEGPRHYIDLDHYGKYPFKEMPRRWKDAVEKYSEDTLRAYGIAPWHVSLTVYKLTEAFKTKNKAKILRLSAELGHYVGDIHVPLHTTKNYNGQLTDQKGIHGLWESRLPELFGNEYDYFVGQAQYLNRPLDEAWKIVLESHSKVEDVLRIEKELTKQFPADRKYTFEERGATTIRTYSKEFSLAYQEALDDMQEDKMRKAILSIGSFWYTAWVDAGQPNLDNFETEPQSITEQEATQKELNKAFEAGKIKGREHGN